MHRYHQLLLYILHRSTIKDIELCVIKKKKLEHYYIVDACFADLLKMYFVCINIDSKNNFTK